MSITAFVFDPAAGRITRVDPPRYAVETRMSDDTWENCWTDGDAKPLTFATRAEAQAELDSLIADTRDAAARGDLADAYDASDYRIVLVPQAPTTIKERSPS